MACIKILDEFLRNILPVPVSDWDTCIALLGSTCVYGVCLTDLVELMMMQNAQMHQVIMTNMTMSALSSFGHMQAPEVNKILHVRK